MADSESETADKILENALAPQSVTGDEGSVTQHSIADQIAAANHKASKAAARRGLGIRFVKLIPPGSD